MNFSDGLYNMYREVDELSLLNKLFTTLISEELNIKNYLANTIFLNKLYLRDYLENMNYLLEDALESIKNLIKIKKGYPIYKIDDIELISAIKTKVSNEYKEISVIENLNEEINIILKLIKDIITQTENYEIITVLSEISYNLKSLQLNIV